MRITPSDITEEEIDAYKLIQEKCNCQDKNVDEEDPCWDGYEQRGMKDKNGKKVPNCVKTEGLEESKTELEPHLKKGHKHINGKVMRDRDVKIYNIMVDKYNSYIKKGETPPKTLENNMMTFIKASMNPEKFGNKTAYEGLEESKTIKINTSKDGKYKYKAVNSKGKNVIVYADSGRKALDIAAKHLKSYQLEVELIEESVLEEKTAYQQFFDKALAKFGVKSPKELDGKKEKEFYDYVDKNWKADDEKPEANESLEEAKGTTIQTIIKQSLKAEIIKDYYDFNSGDYYAYVKPTLKGDVKKLSDRLNKDILKDMNLRNLVTSVSVSNQLASLSILLKVGNWKTLQDNGVFAIQIETNIVNESLEELRHDARNFDGVSSKAVETLLKRFGVDMKGKTKDFIKALQDIDVNKIATESLEESMNPQDAIKKIDKGEPAILWADIRIQKIKDDEYSLSFLKSSKEKTKITANEVLKILSQKSKEKQLEQAKSHLNESVFSEEELSHFEFVLNEKIKTPKGFDMFVKLAKQSKDGQDFYNKVVKIKGVPFELSSWFGDKYMSAGTPRQASQKFIDDVEKGLYEIIREY